MKFFRLLFSVILTGFIITSILLLLLPHIQKQDYLESVIFSDFTFWKKPCEEPLRYSLGTIDEQFNLSESEFLHSISQAESIWENSISMNLFEYDPEAEFTINLIFDQRQQDTFDSQKIQEEIEKQTQSYDSLSKDLDSMKNTYESKLSLYNKHVKDYKDALEEYEKDVRHWNKKGGAPPEEFESLQEEQKEINTQYRKLEEEQKELVALSTRLQSLASQINTSAQVINGQIETYNQRYGNQKEFDQGAYYGTHIDIYQFYELSDLQLVLAHELGHALRIDEHVQNQKSIMYYLMGEQDINEIKLSPQDIEALQIACELL